MDFYTDIDWHHWMVGFSYYPKHMFENPKDFIGRSFTVAFGPVMFTVAQPTPEWEDANAEG